MVGRTISKRVRGSQWTGIVLLTSIMSVSCSSSNFGGGTGVKPVQTSKPPPEQPSQPVATPVAQPQPQSQPPPVVQQPIVQQPIAPVDQTPIIPVMPSPVVTTPVVQVDPVPMPVVNTVNTTLPANTVGMVRVPIIGIVNMDSKYQITNEGYRVSVEDASGRVLASGPLNVKSVMDGEPFDAPGSAYGKPYLLGVTTKYLAPEVVSGEISGQRQAKVSICMPENLQAAWNTKIQCKDLNSFVGHSNGSNTFINLNADIHVQKNQVNIAAIHNANSKGNCGTSKVPCASVMHPIFGFAMESGAFNVDARSPIVLDLNRNGKIDLQSAWRKQGPVSFDLDGHGEKIRMGWIARGDGFLALDLNKNGRIDSGQELFGESSLRIQKDESSASFANGFAALAQYDRNQDGVIDARDPIFSELVVWQDRNSDGLTQAGELVSLARAGVASVSLSFAQLSRPGQLNLVAGNDVKLMGSYVANDGKNYGAADVWFEIRVNRTLAQIMGINR